MDLIRGTNRPKPRSRWRSPRPHLRLIGGPTPPGARSAGEDRFILAMLVSLLLFVAIYAVFVGSRNWP